MTDFLSRPRERRLPREVLRLHHIISSTGGIEWARQAADAFVAAANHEFDASAFYGVPKSSDLDWLRECVSYLVQREA
jgi:geranylgeranyl pyrophosphate synthase